jgi:hypothetical protein
MQLNGLEIDGNLECSHLMWIDKAYKADRTLLASPMLSICFSLLLHFFYCTIAVSTSELHITQWICMQIEI